MTKFIPKIGEKFWWVTLNCFDYLYVKAGKREKYMNDSDIQLAKNCFRTKKSAEEAAKKIKAILKNV